MLGTRETMRGALTPTTLHVPPVLAAHLAEVARARGNVFEALMDAVRFASIGQVSATLYGVGGEYRRNM